MVRMSMILESWGFGELAFWDGFTRPKARKKKTHFKREEGKERKEERGGTGDGEGGGRHERG